MDWNNILLCGLALTGTVLCTYVIIKNASADIPPIEKPPQETAEVLSLLFDTQFCAFLTEYRTSANIRHRTLMASIDNVTEAAARQMAQFAEDQLIISTKCFKQHSLNELAQSKQLLQQFAAECKPTLVVDGYTVSPEALKKFYRDST